MVGLATGAVLILTLLAAIVGSVIVAGRAVRRSRDARRQRLAAPARRLLLALTAGDDDPGLPDRLVTLDAATWDAVEPTAISMLGKVRGEAHAALVAVLERRGMAGRAARDLHHRSAVRRARAAEVLGNFERRDAAPALIGLLADADADVRVVAARALGRLGAAEAAPRLLASLVGRRAIPPQHVAHALMRLCPAAQPALDAALDQPAELVRATAMEVLGLVGAITATANIERALHTDRSLEIRLRAAAALGRLGTRSALGPLLAAVQPEHPPDVRAVAARALGEIGAESAAPALAGLLGDPQHTVANHAAYALLRMGAAGRAALQEAAGGSVDETAGPAADATSRAAAYAREALAVAELSEYRRAPQRDGRRTADRAEDRPPAHDDATGHRPSHRVNR